MNTFENFRSSILRFCVDFAADNSLQVINWDAHADSQGELPKADLIGPAMFELQEDEGTFSVTGMIGISTVNDENLFRLTNYVGKVFELLRPGRRVTKYDALNGAELGVMTAENGTKVLPVLKTDLRPMQFIAFALASG